jgi:hypothetical protein
MSAAQNYTLRPIVRGDTWKGIPLIRRSTRPATGKSSVANASTNVFTSAGHGWTNGQRLYAGVTAAGITAESRVFVISATTDTFQVAPTAGGAAIDLSAGTQTFYAVTVPAVALSKVRMTFRLESTDGSIVLELSSLGDEPTITIEDADAWEISVPPVAAGFPRAGSLVWDIEYIDENGGISTPIIGTIEVGSDCTRKALPAT